MITISWEKYMRQWKSSAPLVQQLMKTLCSLKRTDQSFLQSPPTPRLQLLLCLTSCILYLNHVKWNYIKLVWQDSMFLVQHTVLIQHFLTYLAYQPNSARFHFENNMGNCTFSIYFSHDLSWRWSWMPLLTYTFGPSHTHSSYLCCFSLKMCTLSVLKTQPDMTTRCQLYTAIWIQQQTLLLTLGTNMAVV